MAVESPSDATVSQSAGTRRLTVGTNVLAATLLFVGIVGVLQFMAFKAPVRWDLTSEGVNSLSDATEKLLRGLDQNIRITSLYFETDLEEPDQQRYRRAVDSLLSLYESTNRSKIASSHINPLSDHEGFRGLMTRVMDKTTYKEEIDQYQAVLDEYTETVQPQIVSLIQGELTALEGASGSLTGDDGSQVLGPIQQVLSRLNGELQRYSENVQQLLTAEVPEYSAATRTVKNIYRVFGADLRQISTFCKQQVDQPATLPTEKTYLAEASDRMDPVVDAIDEANTKALELPSILKVDAILREIRVSNSNSILVETDDEAEVVDFVSVWPPVNQNSMGQRIDFDSRGFKGEEKLTAAILHATHKERTGVVFARFGGPPLFLGGFMPGRPPAPFARLKQAMEDANFAVNEWDLGTADAPPPFDPVPTRIIYVVLKPNQPQQGPLGQPLSGPTFADTHRQTLLAAIGDSGRALFVAGWAPGPFGPIPSAYEYDSYLQDQWGISVNTTALLLQAISVEPGKYGFNRGPIFMRDVEYSDHVIVADAHQRPIVLPLCAPLELAETAPEGVELTPLITQPLKDGIWGATDLQGLQARVQRGGLIEKTASEIEGPFTLAAAAEKGEAKVVVISSAGVAADQFAFAQEMFMTSQGLGIRNSNPGNAALILNSLHWLNDNEEFMNLGQPITAAVLAIPGPSTVRWVKALTIFGWPALALCFGGLAWWVRRR